MLRLTVLAGLVLAGCTVPGPSDNDAALEVVYDRQGTPAFAGQAQVIVSCGAGGFCHRAEREGLNPAHRFGAPNGLDFDLSLASTSHLVNQTEVNRLDAHQRNLGENGFWVWTQLDNGTMPPAGAAGAEYARQVEELGLRFDRFSDSGEATPLPGIDTAEGLEIFRNWLSSGAPVVERLDPLERANPIGFDAPACISECVEPTFESIYRLVLRPGCTASLCHAGSEESESDVDMRFEDADAGDRAMLTWARLVEDGSLTEGEECFTAGYLMVDSIGNDPGASLLYRKLLLGSGNDGQCGSHMPLSGPSINDQRLCAIRVWIECGACAPGSDTCDLPCIEAGRAQCGVTDTGECATASVCSNSLPP